MTRTPQIEYQHPGDIDADPAGVADIAIDQLAAILRQALAVHAETGVQLRSSYQSRVLDAQPELPASEVALLWQESETRRRWEQTGDYLSTITKAISACKLG